MNSHSINNHTPNRRLFPTYAICFLLLFVFSKEALSRESQDKPNILYILVDDLGYGDVEVLNPQSKIPTPHLNKLAAEGMNFTDAHSTSSVCTPSRYSIITGRYNWRSRLQGGVIKGGGKALIDEDRLTVAELLRQNGYHTAGFGKWHLGYSYRVPGSEEIVYRRGPKMVIGTEVLTGPTTRGFDDFYFFKGYMTGRSLENPRGHYAMSQHGKVFEEVGLDELLPRMLDMTKEYIKDKSKENTPFFAYFSPHAPHTPLAPSEAWRNKNETIGVYGDFVMEVDDAVGQLMATLEEAGVADNTLVIFTSDNGCAPYIKVAAMEEKGHFPSGPFRGYKADIWEGGHRVPFFVRWPGHIPAGSTNDEPISQLSLMATLAEILKVEIPENAGEDSFSILPLLKGEETEGTTHPFVVHHSINGGFAIRQGDWKLIFGSGSLGWSPGGKDEHPMQLYNLKEDMGETNNLFAEMPEKVQQLRSTMEKAIADGRTTPGPELKNDRFVRLFNTPRKSKKK